MILSTNKTLFVVFLTFLVFFTMDLDNTYAWALPSRF